MNSRALLTCVFLGMSAMLAGIAAHAAPVTYTYQSAPLTFIPPFPGADFSVWGDEIIGTATFDDSLVTPNFTGTINSADFVLTLGNDQVGMHRAFGSVTFNQGQLVDWALQTDFFGNTYIAAIWSTSLVPGGFLGDRFSVMRGVNTFGTARSSVAGEWTLVTPVPLPAALPLLAAGLGLFGAMTSRRRPAQLFR